MGSDKRRQRRLQQVTRLREVEHRRAMTLASEALGEAERKRRLAERAQALVQDIGTSLQATTAHELFAQRHSVQRMREVAQQTVQLAQQAGLAADQRVLEERQAHRKLEQLEEQRTKLAMTARRAAEARF